MQAVNAFTLLLQIYHISTYYISFPLDSNQLALTSLCHVVRAVTGPAQIQGGRKIKSSS